MITFKQNPKNKEVFLQIETVAHDALYAIEQGLYDSGKLMEKFLKKGLKRGSRSGRWYKYNGKRLQSSSAGEFPQRRTGNLKESVAFTVNSYRNMVFGIKNPGELYDTFYAEYLEDGTSKMQPRKLVGFTVSKTQQQSRNLIIKKLNDAIKGR